MSRPALWLLGVLVAVGCATTAPAPPPPPPPAPPPAPTAAPSRTTGTGDTTTGTRSPALVTASAARRLLVTDVTADPHRPKLPARLNKDGARYVGMYKICVGSGGQVDSVKVNKGTGDADLDAEWIQTLRGWRYRPLEMSGRKVPFCYVSTVEASAG
jgi:TonB family protein